MKNILRTIAARISVLLTISGLTDSAVIDMKDYNGLLVSLAPAVITGDITSFKIYAYSDAAMTTHETLVETGAAFPTALGDMAFLEISDSEIAQAGAALGYDDLRYCKVEIGGTDTDKIMLNIERGLPHFPADGLTADSITA